MSLAVGVVDRALRSTWLIRRCCPEQVVGEARAGRPSHQSRSPITNRSRIKCAFSSANRACSRGIGGSSSPKLSGCSARRRISRIVADGRTSSRRRRPRPLVPALADLVEARARRRPERPASADSRASTRPPSCPSGPAARTRPGSSPPRPPAPAASAGPPRIEPLAGAARTPCAASGVATPTWAPCSAVGRPHAVDPMSRTCETTCSVPESGVEIRTIDCASPASSTCRTRNASPSGVPWATSGACSRYVSSRSAPISAERRLAVPVHQAKLMRQVPVAVRDESRHTVAEAPPASSLAGAAASVSRSQSTASGKRDGRVRFTPSTSSTARLEVNAVTEAAVGTSTSAVRAPSSCSAVKQACLATSQTVPDPSATTAVGRPPIAARPRSTFSRSACARPSGLGGSVSTSTVRPSRPAGRTPAASGSARPACTRGRPGSAAPGAGASRSASRPGSRARASERTTTSRIGRSNRSAASGRPRASSETGQVVRRWSARSGKFGGHAASVTQRIGARLSKVRARCAAARRRSERCRAARSRANSRWMTRDTIASTDDVVAFCWASRVSRLITAPCTFVSETSSTGVNAICRTSGTYGVSGSC